MLLQGKNNEVHWQSEVVRTMPIKTLSVTICSSSPKPHRPNCFPSRHPSSPVCCRRNRSRVLPPSLPCCHSFLCPKIQLSSRPFLVSLPCLTIFLVTSPPTSHHRLPSLYPSRQSLSYPNPWNRARLYGSELKVILTQTPKMKIHVPSTCQPFRPLRSLRNCHFDLLSYNPGWETGQRDLDSLHWT